MFTRGVVEEFWSIFVATVQGPARRRASVGVILFASPPPPPSLGETLHRMIEIEIFGGVSAGDPSPTYILAALSPHLDSSTLRRLPNRIIAIVSVANMAS